MRMNSSAEHVAGSFRNMRHASPAALVSSTFQGGSEQELLDGDPVKGSMGSDLPSLLDAARFGIAKASRLS